MQFIAINWNFFYFYCNTLSKLLVTVKLYNCSIIAVVWTSLKLRYEWSYLLVDSRSRMDQHTFVFATRGHCIKGKQCYYIAIRNKIIVCVQNNLAYFPFMHCPLVANRKTRWSIVYKTAILGICCRLKSQSCLLALKGPYIWRIWWSIGGRS